MRTNLLALLCVLSLAGCPLEVIEHDGGTSSTDGPKCPPLPDLMPQPAKCAAAKGLSGDVLSDLCLDMDKIDTQGLTSRGFNLAIASGCGGWEVAGNKLQPKNVNTSVNVNCAMAFPNLAIDAKYSRLMVVLVHQTTLYDARQQARIELSKSPPPDLPIWIWDNSPSTTIKQRTIVEMDVADLPDGRNAQALFRLTAPTSSPVPNWTITSLAVLGVQ